MNAQAVSTSTRAESSKIGVLSSSPSGALAEEERWYAVHTLPCNEARAEWHLGNQGFRTFMPKRRKTVRHARKMSTVDAPFFPRYLFVVLDPSRHQWRRINGTYGVSRLVMCGDMPHPVPRGVVEALVASVDASGILQLGRCLQIGSPVRLLAGPFAEQLAILDHLDDGGRVRVLLDIFGRKVTVSTKASDVLPFI
jgi:transcription elongation factor/antiterminator RfaH